MTIRSASLILPCRRLDDFPTYLTGQSAAELLAAWTAVWHPGLIDRGESLPKWHSADEPPEPETLADELLLVPPASRLRMSADWFERLRAAQPQNPAPIDATASRSETLGALLGAAGIDTDQIAADHVADFLALGHAYLQVELLTNAMRYTSVLDTHQFTEAVVAAAKAAVAGRHDKMREELSRAFDLLADARNHVYSVDFYIIDLTLVAAATLGDPLRAKLAAGWPTSLLLPAELLEVMSREHPSTFAEFRRALDGGAASIVGGTYASAAPYSPESFLASVSQSQQVARSNLERDYEIFGQFAAHFSHLLPEALKSMGFRAALHAAFDGSRLPVADQCKTNWGPNHDTSIEALATSPLDASRPEAWLKLAERIGDTIARDHVATILLASWPGTECEFFDDLRRAGRYNPVLGRLVTLDEYFRTTRESDSWTTFNPNEYPSCDGTEIGPNAISSRVVAFRQEIYDTHRSLLAGLLQVAALTPKSVPNDASCHRVAINPWNFNNSQFIAADPLDFASAGATASASADEIVADTTSTVRTANPQLACLLPEIPACGYSTLDSHIEKLSVPLADGLILRNEQLELTVSQTTGGIQSLRTHRDRSTRVSQRLVFHEHGVTDWRRAESDAEPRPLDTQMLAHGLEVTRNDQLIGEITSHGRLLDSAGALLARFTQRVRAVRGLTAMLVDVELQPERLPEGNIWKSYFASRLAWLDAPLTMRRGDHWTARQCTRERIESPEWVEISDGVQTINCFALGLPFHRRVGESWLDTLMAVAGEEQRRFQFALGLDQPQPTKASLGLLTSSKTSIAHLRGKPPTPQGWFLHVAAKNILITHIEPLTAPNAGMRVRLLETEGQETQTSLSAFRPFNTAQISDFRGNPAGVLSVTDGRVQFDIGPYGWIQIEALW
jgi:alpha-mannosidase